MATAKRTKAPEKIVILDPNTGELIDLPADHLPNRDQNIERSIAHEAETRRKWFNKSFDATMNSLAENMWLCIMGFVLIGTGAVLGAFGQPIYEKHTNTATLAQAMKTSVPVINALTVQSDPGKYVGKLVDVILTPTRGGVFKSGKGLYLSEGGDGLSITLFESTFAAFIDAYKVGKAEEIAPYLIGKTIKARGTIQSRIMKDGDTRLSLVVYSPGLIQIIPEKP